MNPVKFPGLVLLVGLLLPKITTAADRPALRLNDAEVEEAVLFAFDDHAIPYHGNLQLAMERAEKHPANPVMPIGRSAISRPPGHRSGVRAPTPRTGAPS